MRYTCWPRHGEILVDRDGVVSNLNEKNGDSTQCYR
jgi:hypothetical protein